MANIIDTLEQEEIARLGKKIPKFTSGDTVKVGINVVEGTRKRVQIFEGVVISKKNKGLNSSFIVNVMSISDPIMPLCGLQTKSNIYIKLFIFYKIQTNIQKIDYLFL